MAEEVIAVSSDDSDDVNDENEDDDEDEGGDDELIEGRSKTLLDLSDVVYDIAAPGTFACGGPIQLILPGLHIKGYGEVSLPLRERDAKEIITLCQRAPFGRGEQTIVDVRNTWQLNPSELEILNKDFVHQINSLVKDTVAVELGLGSKANVEARLYKLLLYEPGGFFVPHKDTEKEKGMFASLVITLPSHFKGGELIVVHQGIEKKFRPEKPSYSTSYVSFFADCKHEIKPVTSGYRLALVYNVVSLNNGPLPRPASNIAIFNAIKCLRRWKSRSNGPSKALFVLSHQYTPAGLSVQVLKNQDRAMAQVLQEATKELGFDLYLGLLNITRSGAAEGGYDDAWTLMDHYCDESYELHSLVNVNGEHVNLDINIDKVDIYPAGFFDDEGADSESVEEATGNEGTSIELRYHRAVIMLWPKERLFDIICERSESDAIKYLVAMVSECAGIESKEDPEWQNCKNIAERLLTKCPSLRLSCDLLDALNQIGDVQLVAHYISYTTPSLLSDNLLDFCAELEESLETFGWASLSIPTELLCQRLPFNSALVMVSHLISFFRIAEDPVTNQCLQSLAEGLIKTRVSQDPSFVLTPQGVVQMTSIALSIHPTLLTDVRPDVETEFIPTIKLLHEEHRELSLNSEFINLVQRCIAFLQNRINAFNARPDDWAILTPQSCNCVECQKIGAFLRHPTQRDYRYPSPLYNRKHVQNSINSKLALLDIIDFRTETRGSPHTLVISKLTKELDLARQNMQRDAILIAQLQSCISNDESEQERAAKRRKTDHGKEKAVHNISQSNGSGAINDEVISGRPKILVDLAEIVFGVDTPGAFACGGLINNIFPGLHIKDFGEVGLPFREREAKEILPLCQPTPAVSHVFELRPSNIEILNKDFVHQINSLVKDTVAVELGLGSNANIDARLYKLLLYEPGGFFVPHKDTEKEKGMFASLVVTLPSHFEGGDFVINHQNTVRAFKPENPSYTTSYVAFFKDLKHESKPVTSGYRLTLVYNVVSLSNGSVPRPVGNERVLNAKNCLQKWLKLNPGPSKFVYTLAHPFTPTGLSFNDLKNQDRGIVQVLQEAVNGEDFELYLGLLDYSKKGAPEDDEYDRYGNYEGTYDIDEVFEETIGFRSLFTLDGSRIDKTLPIVVNDVYPADAFEDDDADSMSYEERKFPTIELRYRKAVVALFPKRNWIDIMCEGEESDAVKYLASLVSKCLTIESKDAPDWLNCKRMAKILLEKNKHPRVNDRFLESLNAIGDVEMVQKYIEKVITNFYGSEWKSFCTVIEQSLAQFGWEKLAASVTKFIKGPMFDTKVNLLARFTTIRSENPIAVETLKLLAHGLIKGDMNDNTPYVPTAETIGQLARIANATDPTLLTDIFTIIYSRFMNVDLQFIPTAKILYEQVPSIAQRPEFIGLVQQCVAFLQNRIAIGQARADNWTVLTPMSCNCNVCLVIANFMKDTNQVVYRYKAFSAERGHVEDSINKDLTKTFGILKLSTEGSGRATTLVIQKVKKESDIAKQTAAKDTATVTELISIVADNDADQDRALKRQKVDHTS